jgi:hypothetical protein
MGVPSAQATNAGRPLSGDTPGDSRRLEIKVAGSVWLLHGAQRDFTTPPLRHQHHDLYVTTTTTTNYLLPPTSYLLLI